jgi:FliI/YscN family ATPase
MVDGIAGAVSVGVTGQVRRMTGLTVEAANLPLPVGNLCRINTAAGRMIDAEVIGFTETGTLLMPLAEARGISRGDRVSNVAGGPRIPTGTGLLGRVIDGAGRPIDNLGPLPRGKLRRLDGRRPDPLERRLIRQPISTGTRCIDALMTCGQGQRLGLFAGPGVGKSTLMASIAKQTSADVSVIALIGERGREVQEFLHEALGEEGLKRCVVIVATGDDPPLLKVRAAKVACTVAESLRDEGADVLLLMDSLTRLAQAQRQIGLAAGEPPATRGFPPSVFALLPQILERAGKTEQGSITGFYTVLVEGNDFDEPIPDAVKGIADGHILLSRDLAAKGHYPAIDVLHSISRVRNDVVDGIHRQRAERVLRVEAAYRDIEDLISVGAYVPGQNAEQDLAVAVQDDIKAFLQQRGDERPDLAASTSALEGLFLKIEQKAAELRQRPAQAQPAA